MKIQNILLVILIIILLAIAVRTDIKLGATSNQLRLSTCTNTTSTVATSGATTILAGTTGSRMYASINVASTSPAVYLSFGSATATAAGVLIQASGRYDINESNMWVGDIKALPVGGTAGTVYITECY